MTDLHTTHPGVLLKQRFLDPLGIAPHELARAIGVTRRRVADLIAGRRPLTTDMAFRLALYFDVPARWWLEMRARFEADDPDRLAALRSIVEPFSHPDSILVTPVGVRLLDMRPTEPAPRMVEVSPELLDRLRAQARLAPPRAEREPVVVTLPDGWLLLTGQQGSAQRGVVGSQVTENC